MTCSPYSIVENIGFTTLMKFALPNYHLPSRTTFSQNRIPALYARTKQTIRDRLRCADFVALSTDGWTGLNGHQFLCLTCAFVDPEWELETITLACRELNDTHTKEHIVECLQSILKEYDISADKVAAITTDRAAKMIAAIDLLKANHVACFAHAMNTIVHNMLGHEFILPTLQKAKRTNNLLAHSPLAQRSLTECQVKAKLPTIKMPSSCPTRWWYELAQIDFVLTQKVALFDFLTTYNSGVHEHLQVNLYYESLVEEDCFILS